jgi:hypothetical protein
MTDAAEPATRPPTDRITIVSGLPRSGTSVMMQMLAAGGVGPVTDELRRPDEDNPRGYYEFERAKKIKTDRGWLPEARGRAVKMVHLLLLDLPTDGSFGYDVVFMRRDLAEVVKSQGVMLARAGKSGAALAPEQLMGVYRGQIDRVLGFTRASACFRVIEVSYNELVREPRRTAEGVAAFLGRAMDLEAMARAVDPSLYRNRGT